MLSSLRSSSNGRSPLSWASTPLIHAKNLGDVIGHPKVYLKDETKHPTRTTKDRMASGVYSYFREIELFEFVSSSTGNSSTSFAIGAGAYPGKVIKGMGMFGRMGNARVTVRNLEVVRVDVDRNLLMIRGAIPGHNNGLVRVRNAVAPRG